MRKKQKIMKKDQMDHYLKTLFKNEEVDLAEPNEGHKLRFMKKLQEQNQQKVKRLVFWKPLAIAASFLVIIALGFPFLNEQTPKGDLASVSPEFAQTQYFFTSTIQKELENLNREKSPQTIVMVEDALKQMEVLEKDYEKLKKDLVKSGNDERVIHAMIINFQSRIELLQNVLEQIKELKNLKQKTHETTI